MRKEKAYIAPSKESKTSIPDNCHNYKWRMIRWSFLICINFLFFASFHWDIQVLEGTLSASRFLGFHLEDPFMAMQVMLASKIVKIDLIIGLVSVILIYLILGGRFFCSWVCPYHFFSEIGKMVNRFLSKKGFIKKNIKFNNNIKYYFFVLFLLLTYITGFKLFETINPVAILSRSIVYGPGLILSWVILLFLFEIFFSRQAWCRYLCPVGVSYSLIGRISLLKIKCDTNKCSNCGKCFSVCINPIVLSHPVNGDKTNYVLSGECTRCGLCIDTCKDGALKYHYSFPLI